MRDWRRGGRTTSDCSRTVLRSGRRKLHGDCMMRSLCLQVRTDGRSLQEGLVSAERTTRTEPSARTLRLDGVRQQPLCLCLCAVCSLCCSRSV